MSIQKELDNVRKKNLDNQILDIFDKLNKQCQDSTGGMNLEQLLEEVERIELEDFYPDQPDELDQPQETEWSHCPACDEWAIPKDCQCMACGYDPYYAKL
jgi:hypothetical protein